MTSSGANPVKKLLLIVVDACTSHVLLPAMQKGQLPNIQALAQAGSLNSECISVFPSITPAATAAIVTGQYPSGHHILGAHWYDTEQDEVVYYSDDFWVIWNQGLGKFFEDFLVRLNYQRLQSDTLFQIIERGGLQAASLNYLIFRGDVKHTAEVPPVVSLLPGIPPSKEVYGPSIMYFGDLVDTEIEMVGEPLNETGGVLRRFGFDDNNSAHLLIELATRRLLPDFTLAYFPDNDYHSHQVGPQAALSVLQNVDAKLGQLFEVFGGVEQTLAELCIVLTGDHSQSDVLNEPAVAGIQLNEILADFTIAEPGKPWESKDQLVICINLRTALLYFQHPTPRQIQQAVEQLLTDQRIDQVIWRAEDTGENKKGYYVATGDRGHLRFWPGSDDPHTAVDRYGNTWSWQGNLNAVDGQVSAENVLTFPNYPNAFERIVGALNFEHSGHIWVTAHPGYEFKLPGIKIHSGGGSHGSLHVLDSTSPLLVAGTPPAVQIPSYPRTVDLAPLCLSVLGLKAQL